MKKSLILLTMLTAGIASAATYHVKITDPMLVNSARLSPGSYKVEVTGNKAVFRSGKTEVEAPVTVQNDATRHPSTTMNYEKAGDTEQLQTILIGGSNTMLVFGSGS